MAKLSTATFLDYLTQSGLVAERDLRRSLDALREKCGGELPEDAESVADWFIGGGLITRWHADKLFDKKYKGFRLGKYKLLTLLGRRLRPRRFRLRLRRSRIYFVRLVLPSCSCHREGSQNKPIFHVVNPGAQGASAELTGLRLLRFVSGSVRWLTYFCCTH